MTTMTKARTGAPQGAETQVLARLVREGYGPGAWHGPDLKAALADVGPDLAFWRPAPGAHNIAEIALHHAYCARSVRGRLTGAPPEPFVLPGEDWFEAADGKTLAWPRIQTVLETEQQRLAEAVAAEDSSPAALSPTERFDLVLGITSHAIYHAGQVQLLKRLHAGA
jgi:DinB superfamily